MSLIIFSPHTRKHFMANTVILTSWNKHKLKLWHFLNHKRAHLFYYISCLVACQIAKPLVCNVHQFLSIHVPNHANRLILRRFLPVVVILPVVTLRTHIRLRVYMSAQMDAHPVRALDVEGKKQAANRTVSCFENLPLPFFSRSIFYFFPDCN